MLEKKVQMNWQLSACLCFCLLLNGCDDSPPSWSASTSTPIISGPLPYLDAGSNGGLKYFLVIVPVNETWLENSGSPPNDSVLPRYMPNSVGGTPGDGNVEVLQYIGSSYPGMGLYRVTGITLTIGGKYSFQLIKAHNFVEVQDPEQGGERLYSIEKEYDGQDIDTSAFTGIGEF